MTSKINKALELFIKNEFFSFTVNELNKYLELDFDDEKVNDCLEHLKTKYDEKYITSVKKRTPRTPKSNSNDEEEDKDIYITYEEMLNKIKSFPGKLPCGWVFGRGPHKDKFCAINVRDSSEWSKEDRENFVQRCGKCIRHNSMKKDGVNVPNKDSIEKNTKKVMSFKIGSQVRGTPVKDVTQLPNTDNELPAETLTGISKDMVSPTPESFLAGQETGATTPTKAKSKKDSPGKKPCPVKNLKHGTKDNYTDFRSSSRINGNYILVRRDSNDKIFFGGKFEDEEDLKSSVYLQGVTELDDDDIKELEKYYGEYKFCGPKKGKKNPEDLEIPNLDEDDDDNEGKKNPEDLEIPNLDEDDDDEDNVDDLLEGLNVN